VFNSDSIAAQSAFLGTIGTNELLREGMMRFDDRVVIVTGAGKGIGKAHAEVFSERGAVVLVNDIDRGAADAVVAEIAARGGDASANYDSVVSSGDKIVGAALDALGKIDVLINNAGVGVVPVEGGVPFCDMPDAQWQRLLNIHLNGTFSCSRAVWKHMECNGYGRILMTTSPVGLFGAMNASHYSAAKAGVFGLMQCLSLEGKDKNILCNALSPVAASEMTKSHFSGEFLAASDARYIAELAAWLAHEDCTETGKAFEAGGGFIHQLRFEMSRGISLFGEAHTAEAIRSQVHALKDFEDSIHPGIGDMDITVNEIHSRIAVPTDAGSPSAARRRSS